MGIRRWLGLADRPRPNRANAGAGAPAVDGYRGVDAAEGAYNDFSMTARLPDVVDATRRPSPSPASTSTSTPTLQPEAVPEPIGGTLVLGSTEHRTVQPELPAFYRPPAPEPRRPYDDAALLAKYSDYDRSAVREAFALVEDRLEDLVKRFYAELFVRLREAPTMFPSDMTTQRHEFGKAVVQWVVTDDPDAMKAHLQQLGAA